MPTITRRNPFESPGRPPVAIANSPGRLTSKASAPCSKKTSNFNVFGWPNAMRDALRLPVAPLAKCTA